MQQGIERFLDEEGKLKLWPAKRAVQEQIYAYLAQKFTPGRDYTEHEVNAILAVGIPSATCFCCGAG